MEEKETVPTFIEPIFTVSEAFILTENETDTGNCFQKPY